LARHASVQAASNTVAAVRAAVDQLLDEALDRAGYERSAVLSGVLLAGDGIDVTFPATAARECGLDRAALTSMQRAGPRGGDLTIEALLHVRGNDPQTALPRGENGTLEQRR
jgi:chorismate mutase